MRQRDSMSKRRARGGRARGPQEGGAGCQEPGAAETIVCSTDNSLCDFCKGKLFAGIAGRRLEELGKRLSNCHCRARQTLFRAGDASRYLYVIREGQVKLTRMDADGHEHLLDIAGPDYFLGFDAIGNTAYTCSAETLTPCVFCRIQHDDIVALLNEEPRVSLNVLLAVNEQLGQARRLMRVLGQKSAVEKVASLLLSLYPPADGTPHADNRALHLSRQEMARSLGLTVETVSRIMARLRRGRVLHAPPGRIVILNRARLQKLAGDLGDAKPAKRKSRPRRRRAATTPAANDAQNLRLS